MNFLRKKQLEVIRAARVAGFSLVEVMVAMAITIIVMATVFGLLARGLSTSDREHQQSDVQAQARHALSRLELDIVGAGRDLPLELFAFTPPGINPVVTGSGDSIEVIGNMSSGAVGEPIRVLSYDPWTRSARLQVAPVHLERGDLVLLYDDAPVEGAWIFGLVSSVSDGAQPEVILKTQPGDTEAGVTLPWFIDKYNRSIPESGYLTPVTVITYSMGSEEATIRSTPDASSEQVLLRQVNWSTPEKVALLEDLQIRYLIGGTTDSEALPDPGGGGGTRPEIHYRGPRGGPGTRGRPKVTGAGPTTELPGLGAPPPSGRLPPGQLRRPVPPVESTPPPDQPREVIAPPLPQPRPDQPVRTENLVRSVRISVTGRSQQANLTGSKVRPGESASDEGYLRVTYSSSVAARNLLFRIENLEAAASQQ